MNSSSQGNHLIVIARNVSDEATQRPWISPLWGTKAWEYYDGHDATRAGVSGRAGVRLASRECGLITYLETIMGIVLKADFKTKLNSRLSKFNPKNTHREYHEEIFSELFGFPQFKAHVAAYLERHYCVVVNDEDHPDPKSLLEILQPDEVRMLNEWIVNRHNKPSVVKQEK